MRLIMNNNPVLIFLLIGLSSCRVRFWKETEIRGLRKGQTNGVSWGFLDGDNYPDLFLSRHNESHPALHINRAAPSSPAEKYGNGTSTQRRRQLVDVTEEYLGEPPREVHKHAAQWADIDNDGDQDLLVLHATKKGWGGYANQLFINDPHLLPFSDEAESRNLNFPTDRGNMPVFFDYDSDGLLDVLLCSSLPRVPLRVERKASRILKQVRENNSFSHFVEIADEVKMTHMKSERCDFGVLADVNDDGRLDLVTKLRTKPQQIHAYELNENHFEELTYEVKLPSNFVDFIFADFNNDGKVDMFGIPYCMGTEQVWQGSPQDAETMILPGTQWISFYTEGKLQIVTEINHVPVPDAPTYAFSDGVYARLLNLHLPDLMVTNVLDLEHQGWYRTWNISSSFSKTGWWRLPISSFNQDIPLAVFLRSSKPISNITETQKKGRRPAPTIQKGLLSMKVDGKFVPRSILSETRLCGVALVSADFDNDMDVDIFILRGSIYCDQQSVFLWNDGKGNFEVEERSPFDCEQHYRPESVAVADYNLDGFMDLAITSGRFADPFHQGAYAVLENESIENGGNHWIEIRLIGAGSVNRDAIGSWVTARTPDGVEQYRAQDGGVHGRAQDWQMLHFGLGPNLSVDLEVHWSDGTVTSIANKAADQVIEIFHKEAREYKEYQV